MKQWLNLAKSTPFLLWVLCAFTYGGSIRGLGFYWDDWPYLWIGHQFGPSGYPAFVASDRPFSAWIFMLTFALFGEHALGYHLLALLLRWAGVVAFWWVLRQVWPERGWMATAAAVLFAVYPGFGQQPIALIYNHHFSVLAMFLFSLGGMLWAARHPAQSWPVTLFALVGAAGMFSLEYFAALELLRPALLGLVLKRQGWQGRALSGRVLRHWAPYAALLVAFLFWRVVVFGFPSYQPEIVENLNEPGLAGLLKEAAAILVDILQAGGQAWLRAWPGAWESQSGWTWLVAVAAGALSGLALAWAGRPVAVRCKREGREAVALGLAALFLAGWPFWVTHLDLFFGSMRDRLTLAFIPGAALLLTGLLQMYIPGQAARILLVALLAGSSAGWHDQNGRQYVRHWEEMKSMFWQLTLRVPGLQPGASLLANDIPLIVYSDNSLTAPLNWIYAPEFSGARMPYLLDFISVRLGRGLPRLEENVPVTQDYRSLYFSSTTRQSMVIVYQPPGCLRVIAPEIDLFDPTLPPLVVQAGRLSHLDQVLAALPAPAVPPTHIFGERPAPDWCAYYQMASLALQQGEWQDVLELGERAYAQTPGPDAAIEHLVFAEGYARAGEWQKAARLVAEAVHQDSQARPPACALWTRLAKSLPSGSEHAPLIDAAETQVGCE